MSASQKSGSVKVFTAQPRPTRYHRHRGGTEATTPQPHEAPVETPRREPQREE